MTNKQTEPFVVMVKPVGSLCNMRCGYCYYLDTKYESKQARRMSEALLESFIRKYISASPGPVVSFTWHGGEPTLAGLDFYRRAVELQRQYIPEGWSCWNNLQTNGLLLDEKWCAFLAQEHFDVGLSIDGTRWLHDEFRKDQGGGGTYDRAAEAVSRLQAHGIQPDLLCTVNSSTAKEPLAVYHALRNLNTGWMQFIPIVRQAPDGQVTPDSVTGKEYGDFLCAVFDEWIRNDLGKLDIQLFAETALVMAGGSASLCSMAPTCGRVLIVEHDGGVYSCDHFVTPEHRIGNIETSALDVLVDSPTQRRFGRDKTQKLPGQCRACAYLSLCSGGCPKDRLCVSREGEPGLNYLCEGFMRFFSHAQEPISQVMEQTKRGISPEAIMSGLRGKERALWRGVGRNDPCPCGSGRKAKNCCWSKRP